ncbi:MAG: peptide chain release factor N(5)-glutamine methyltransferase [Clostridiales bacterium]|nr:peptide chain release factor N(5)-glutamine methyltransferase [Clostridiales bacterium]
MTIGEALTHSRILLEKHGIPDPETDSLLLVSHIAGLDMLMTRLEKNRPLTTEQEQRLSSLLLSRTQRKPLQYLLGEQWFYGRRFIVDKRVLIPRQETESLCSLAISFLTDRKNGIALDLCTGSGAIAVTLAAECPHIQVYASDLSPDALDVARMNATANQVTVSFCEGDLFEAVSEGLRFDVIISNPPYIPSADCKNLQQEVLKEPVMALDGGGDGLDFYRRIVTEAPHYLKPGGALMMEIGYDQGEKVSSMCVNAGYVDVLVHRDLYGQQRMVTGKRPL